jgi:hypothetical protein
MIRTRGPSQGTCAAPLGARDARVDEQHTVPTLHDHGVAPDELTLVNENALSDLREHGAPQALDEAG